jgi:hypothetical protein
VRCGDRSCSVDGACPLNSPQRDFVLNSPPRIQLLSVPASDSHGVVQVPHGWLYAFCEPGSAGTVSEPCEPGAYQYITTVLWEPVVFLTHYMSCHFCCRVLCPLVRLQPMS